MQHTFEAWIVQRHIDYEGSDVLGVFETEAEADLFLAWIKESRANGDGPYGDDFDAQGWKSGDLAMSKGAIANWEAYRDRAH